MGPSVNQLLIVLAIIILIFGAKKIPELAKGLGSGIKNFKKAVKEDEENPQPQEISQAPDANKVGMNATQATQMNTQNAQQNMSSNIHTNTVAENAAPKQAAPQNQANPTQVS